MTGSTAVTVTGNNLNNTIVGNDANNFLYGLNGNDLIEGGFGNDTIYGDGGTLGVSPGPNVNDALYGNQGNDTLYGENGNDLLSGGAGADILNGGAGADRFVFDGMALGTGVDRITEFSKTAGDILDLSDVFAYGGTWGGTVQAAINNFVFATTSGANTIISVDLDGTGTAHGRTDVVTLSNVTGVSITDLYNSGNIDVIV